MLKNIRKFKVDTEKIYYTGQQNICITDKNDTWWWNTVTGDFSQTIFCVYLHEILTNIEVTL